MSKDFEYIPAAKTTEPGYLAARMALYQQKVREQERLKRLAARRAQRRRKE